MLTFLALLMIIVFIVLLSKNKLSVFGALTIIPFVFGAIATFVTGASFLDLFEWIKEGILFSVDEETGKVPNSISASSTSCVAIFYFQ